jgi:hypothetical protein
MNQAQQIVRQAFWTERRNFTRHAAMVALLMIAVTVAGQAPATDNKACNLLTMAELEPVTGKLAPFKSAMATAEAQLCTARSSTGTVMLRWTKSKTKPGEHSAAAKGVEAARDMGATVEVKTFGPITCSTMIPPAKMNQYGYNTTCSVIKGEAVAAVEVGARFKKDMVSMDKLRPLAEKLATRF